jgi:two-component system LytT family response regulator
MRYRAVLVDDEELARKRLLRLLKEEPAIEVVGTAGNGRQALDLVEELKPDLLFLDIQMPGLSGFDVIQRLRHVPVVIFTTAYDEYALQAFETSAVDYLLKPIEKVRLHKAIDKFMRLRGEGDDSSLGGHLEALLRALEQKPDERFLSHIPVKLGERILVFPIAEASYFYASDKCTLLVIGEKEYIIDRTLTELEERLDPRCFVRIHRGTIVNIGNVKEIVSWFGGRYLCRLKHPPKDLPVSRSMTAKLRQVFGF